MSNTMVVQVPRHVAAESTNLPPDGSVKTSNQSNNYEEEEQVNDKIVRLIGHTGIKLKNALKFSCTNTLITKCTNS